MLLTSDQEMIRDAVRDFAQRELWPHAAEWDKKHHFPKDVHKGLAELGAYGICVPEELGGAGLDYVTLALVLEEIAAGDGGTSTVISVTNCPVNAILMKFGNAQQQKQWLEPLARGEMLGAFCLTEPHVGSDASSLRTTAVKDGDSYVINGVKQFITSGKNGDVAIVIAVTDKGAGKKGMSAFLVPTNAPGYVVARLEDKLGQHSSDTAQINFDNCRIPAENLIGKEGDAYVINGVKQFITSGKNGHVAIVIAVTDKGAGKKGMSAFIVPTNAPGYQVARLEDKLGQHSSDTAQINFDNCRIPAENLIGQEGEGYKIALSALEGGRIGIAAPSIGMARSAFEAALQYSKDRVSFGTAIFNHQAVGFRLADCATQLEAARQLMYHAASLRDAGLPCLKEAAMAKLFASETAEQVCSVAIQTLGGYGVVNDFPVERIYRDVRVCQIYEGTSDVQKIIIQRALA